MGYHQAGFEVVGVDIQPQKHYPFEFHQADAMTYPLDGFDVIHASPPCQRYSSMTNCRPGLSGEYPDLLDPTREMLKAHGKPWIIENVSGADLPWQDDLFGRMGLMLCGQMFGLELYRHRLFEASFPLPVPPHPMHITPASRAGHWVPGTIMSVAGHCYPVAVARKAMGIDWMTTEEMSEAIPPAYTRYIGMLTSSS